MKNTKVAKKTSIEIVEITPAIASSYLNDTNFDNRNLDSRTVDRIARDIQAGRWVFDANPIRFDKNNNVIDGQHRLWAVIKSGCSIEAIVVRGLEDKAKDTIDTGKSRSISDLLHFNGHKNTSLLAAACRLVIGYESANGDLMKWSRYKTVARLSHQDVIEKCAADKEIGEAVAAINSLKFIKKFLGGSVAALAYYLLRRSVGKDKHIVDAFFRQLEKGENLKHGDAILTLRNAISIRDLRAYRLQGGTYASAYRLAIVIKGWNAWRNNERPERLVLKENEAYPTPRKHVVE